MTTPAEIRKLIDEERGALVDAQTDVVGGMGRWANAKRALDSAVQEALPSLLDEIAVKDAALTKISAIRDSIVGMQGFNFSEHAYPLVAALGEAGYRGVGYEIARKNLGTLIEQIKAAEGRIAELEAEVREAVKPWADFHGDLPDYDHPMRCVFESGVQYAVELLAKQLGVDDYEPCDGTEEFDGDLGGTMLNIIRAAGSTDEHGDYIPPSELRQRALAVLASPPAETSRE